MFLVSRKFLIVLVIASLLGCAGGYYMSDNADGQHLGLFC